MGCDTVVTAFAEMTRVYEVAAADVETDVQFCGTLGKAVIVEVYVVCQGFGD